MHRSIDVCTYVFAKPNLETYFHAAAEPSEPATTAAEAEQHKK